MKNSRLSLLSILFLAISLGFTGAGDANDFWSLDTLKFWKRDKGEPEPQVQPPAQADPNAVQTQPLQPPAALPEGTGQTAPVQPGTPTVERGPVPPADIPNALSDTETGQPAAPSLALAEQFQGIWGLSEDVCSGTQTIEDIVDDQALAIKGNRVFFSDSQCRVLQTEGDYSSGQNVLIRCVDIDNQRYETEVLLRPLGGLKLEISAGNQSSLQYSYCAPAQGKEPAAAAELDQPVAPEPGAAQKELTTQ